MPSPIPQNAVIPIEIRQGSTFSLDYFTREDDGTTVIPLTGYSARSEVRTSSNHGSLVATFTCAVDSAAGKVTLSLTSAQTEAMAQGGVYDVELFNAATPPNVVALVKESKATLIFGVTDA